MGLGLDVFHPFGDAEEDKGEEAGGSHHPESKGDVLGVGAGGVGYCCVGEWFNFVLAPRDVVGVERKEDEQGHLEPKDRVQAYFTKLHHQNDYKKLMKC